MAKFKILISDSVAEVCSALLREQGFEVDFLPGLKPEKLLEIIRAYHGLIVRSGTKVTAEVIQRADNLKVIGRAGTGVDNIDVAAATQKGIAVLNTAKGNTISTAEHTFALMLALARKIPQAQISMLNGKWEKSELKGVELYGKTLGILGLGKIGREVAKRAKAFQMLVIVYDPLIGSEVFTSLGVEAVDLQELFRQSDFVTIHVPYMEETKNLVGEEQFGICKSDLRLINAARGGIVNEEALYRALKSGKIAGAALDVYEKEPPEYNPLIGLGNVISTPHLGAGTFEAQQKVAKEIAESVANFLQNKSIDNIVNQEIIQTPKRG